MKAKIARGEHAGSDQRQQHPAHDSHRPRAEARAGAQQRRVEALQRGVHDQHDERRRQHRVSEHQADHAVRQAERRVQEVEGDRDDDHRHEHRREQQCDQQRLERRAQARQAERGERAERVSRARSWPRRPARCCGRRASSPTSRSAPRTSATRSPAIGIEQEGAGLNDSGTIARIGSTRNAKHQRAEHVQRAARPGAAGP